MIFNSYIFVLCFLPLFLMGYYYIRHLFHLGKLPDFACNLWIIAGSLIFYGFFGIKNFTIIVISILFNICSSIPLEFMRSHNRTITLAGKKIAVLDLWFTVAILGNLMFLLFFKLWNGMFPIAISFYTFNQLMFITDLKRGDIEKFGLMDYLTYILFFPKLLQGPLMGYEAFQQEIGKSFKAKRSYEKIMRGLLLFSIGLFKKVLLADTFGKAVNFAYDNIAGLGSLEAFLTAVFYSFQLYFDFSGYCDMAGAVSMMMDIELPLNFDSPYQAVNILDFWKRWHITLTKFFTKYVYIPLGGNRKGAARTYVNTMIIFLLSGFWHGNGINFVVWGALHGILYVVTKMIYDNWSLNRDKGILHGLRVFITFLYVTMAWVFFRAPSVGAALSVLGKVFTGGQKAISTGFSSCFQLDELWYVLKVTPVMKLSFAWEVCMWIFMAASVVMIFFCPNAFNTVKKCKMGLATTLLTAVLLFWSIVSFSGVSTFLYMNF